MQTETINKIALSLYFQNKPKLLWQLFVRTQSASRIIENINHLEQIIPELNARNLDISSAKIAPFIEQAKKELDFALQHNIRIITADDPQYPQRLKEVCPDAPIVLYLRGNADLNANHILSIVGTRQSTPYGAEMTENIVRELSKYYKDLLIISGLAYGIDINAHRAAIETGLPTVGVLAHGLDNLYPATHRTAAKRMIENGGLLSEFSTNTKIEPYNFIRRNRIIAGLSQGTLVIESKLRGGSLSTARMADEYNLTVMACPGRATDETSEGCNNMIRQNRAAMISSAADVVESLGWERPNIQTPQDDSTTLCGEEKYLYNFLDREGKHINQLSAETGLSFARTISILNDLEFRNIVAQLPGARWKKK